jgi:cytochrome c553
MTAAAKPGRSILALLLASSCSHLLAAAAGDEEVGREKAAICVTCHGADGLGISPNVPNLRGQKTEYFVNSLKSYKKRDRRDPLSVLMYPFADDLSEQDMKDIAAYYAGLADDCGGATP